MNEEVNPVESPSGDNDTPPPPAMRDGWHVAADGLTATLYKDNEAVIIAQDIESLAYRLGITEAQVDSLITKNNQLVNEQISGDDYRLTDFWEKAQELADRAGHCSVYDEIAEALGGPRREREYEVEFTLTQTITVMARDEDSAEEYARDMLCNYSADDLYEYEVRVDQQ